MYNWITFLECQVHESRQIGSGQTRDSKSERRYFRNQQTWTGMSDFNLDDHYIYYCGQESLRRNGVTSWSTKEYEMHYLGAISKTTE